jgi:hypothetical protein
MKEQIETPTVIITKHAFKRAKKRLSFTTGVLKKMATRAYESGINRAETKGFLHQYVDRLCAAEHATNNIRIYGDILYLFVDNILITLYPVPSAFRKLLRVSKHITA